MLLPQTVLQGRYRIIRQLGQGGMGAVYEAIDERLDTTVALKETLFNDERLSKQFEREARLLARLHHPALPRVSDHFSEGDGQFLVMQFIGGDDLAEKIASRRGPFPMDQALTWADQLLDALDYLHTQEPQIIHRDIKPQNLKLTTRGQIILLDFGLAKGQTSEVSRVTTSASIFGYTPNYAPLEQIQGLGTDVRSDLYALAATLYHLLTGIKPPDALTRAAAIVNGQPDPLKPANEVSEVVTAGVAGVLQRAMAQNREQRYANAAEMRRELQSARLTGATQTVRTEADTVLFAPAAVPTISPVTRPNVSNPTVQPGETTLIRTAARAGKRGVPAWVFAALAVVVLGGLGGLYAYLHRTGTANSNPAPPTQANENTVNSANSNSAANSNVARSAEVTTKVEPASKPASTNPPAVVADKNADKSGKKTEKPAKQKEAAAKQSSTSNATQTQESTREGQGHAERNESPREPETPNAPNVNTPDAPKNRPRFRVLPGGVTIRTLPNGTQIITSPDGTRVRVNPDGSRQVFQPGQKRRNDKP